MAVYDEEKQRDNQLTPSEDAPEQRRDEFSEIIDKNFSDKELKEMEDSAYDGAIDDKKEKTSAESGEEKSLGAQLKGYYNDDEFSEINANSSSLLKNKKARRSIVATVAIGIPAIVFAAAFLPNLLGLFKIENFVQNIEASTFARLNATFDRRSDAWMKAYVKLRLTEVDGGVNGQREVLYLRANRVDTDNPVRDWYRTMRASKFEDDLYEKHGIRFTSALVTQADGSTRIRLARMEINDTPVGSLADAVAVGTLDDTRTFDNLLNSMDTSIDQYFDREIFNNDKQARKAIKTAVNDNTQAWRVFKRRHLRKDIQNMTGVRDWRLFAGTRDKIDDKKSSIQTAIMRKVLPENKTGQLIGCVFGANSCPGRSDPASADAKNGTGTTQVGAPDADVDAEGNPTLTDEAGNAIDTAGAGDLGEEAGEAISGTIGEAADGEVADSIRKTFLQQITSLIGNPYTKVWSTMKKLAKVHEFFSNGTLSSFVTNARRSQYMAANASMLIALSQLKSGDIRGTETLFENKESASIFGNFAQVSANIRDGQVNEFMSFFDGAEKSEGWILYSGGRKGNSDTVSAQSTMTRDVYCTESTEAQKKAAPVQFLCPDDGLNGGSVTEIEDAYNRTAGKLLYPIWKAVDEVKTLPVIGGVINYASDKFEQLSDAAIGPVVDAVLETTGLNKSIETVAMAGVTKALEFAGAGVKYTPTSPGQLNYMLLGSSASAEASARQAGAAAATTLSTEYSNKLAAEWKAENEANQSTFDRIASLSNPKSFASNALMAIATSKPSDGLKNVADPMQSLNNFAKSLSGTAFAQSNTGINASSVAKWGGVQEYDFPKECVELNPLAPGYFQNVTNAPAAVPRDKATLTNPDVFWEKVYAALPADSKASEAQAAGIYNCALIDERVKGGLGYTSGGYENDGGLGDTPEASAAASSPSTSGLVPGQDLPAEDTSAMTCPVNANVTDRGVVEGWKNGKQYNIRLCRVHGVDVNAVVAKAYDEMFTAMKTAGFDISGTYGWRSMEAQQTLFARAGSGTAARPGFSNHQYGTAADISCNDSLNNKYTAGSGRGRTDFYNIYLPRFPCLKWVSDNSAKFGLLLQCNGTGSGGREIRATSGGCEAWHISPTGG
jgi:hypothetical protein